MAVPATVEAFLPLAVLKAELRIPADDTEHDTLLENQRGAAVSWIERHISAPVVARSEPGLIVDPPATPRSPVTINVRDVSAVTEVRYWSTVAVLRDEPDGVIAAAALGRLDADRYRARLYPPVTGWPPLRAGSDLIADVTRGIEEAALRQAAVLLVRSLYDGRPYIKADNATFVLLRPFVALV